MSKHLLLFLVCLMVAPALADDPAQANRLVVEAAKMMKAADTEEGTTEKLALLEAALAKLNEIIEHHPSSGIAVMLITDQPIGSLSLARLTDVVEQLRTEVSRQQQRDINEDEEQRGTEVSRQQQGDENEEQAIQAYRGLILQELESHKRYPRMAERIPPERPGRPAVHGALGRRGAQPGSYRSCQGHESFRSSALRALARVGQLPPFPAEIRRRELLVEMPLTYNLDY